MRKTFKEIPYYKPNPLLYNEIPCYRRNSLFTIEGNPLLYKEMPYE